MKLTRIAPVYPIVRVQCFKCGRMVSSVDAVVDLDGPAFKAFYCPGCVPRDKQEEVRQDDYCC